MKRLRIINLPPEGPVESWVGRLLCRLGLHKWNDGAIVFNNKNLGGRLVVYCRRPRCQQVKGGR